MASLPPSPYASLTLAELLRGFFYFFGFVFNPTRSVVSVRVGGLLEKEEVEGEEGGGEGKGRKKRVLWRMAIEDPFECYGSKKVHDLGDVMKEAMQKKMLEGFREAYRVMSQEDGGEGGRRDRGLFRERGRGQEVNGKGRGRGRRGEGGGGGGGKARGEG